MTTERHRDIAVYWVKNALVMYAMANNGRLWDFYNANNPEGLAADLLAALKKHVLWMAVRPIWPQVQQNVDELGEAVASEVMGELAYDLSEAGQVRRADPLWFRKALRAIAKAIRNDKG